MNPGTQVGPYRVESLIGSGGMGEVYLAIDTRLDRNVAIKVLSQRVSADPALRERFDREAKTISSLNHPNICSLFDLGQHEGASYLVMEYLQGETLADRIARGPLPAQQAIRIGIEIANALAAAHRQGIIHRDLKPGNVMLTKSGVKLLDFGLAKLAANAADDVALKTSLATEQKPLTEQGAILGTFQYMSPEALEGREADARSDIFALGAILYEMVTARRAFQGTSRASLIASILDRDPPPMTELQPMAPAALERVVRACLAKDPDDRIQTAHDVALELKWIGESSSVVEPLGLRRRRKLAPWIAAGLFAAIAAALGAMYWSERTRPDPPYTLSIVAPAGHTMQLGMISPDGRSFAFIAWDLEAGEGSLWVRRLDDGALRRLATNLSRDYPFWSPDGRWIGFEHSSRRIMRVSVDGGEPETLCRCTQVGRVAWNEEGTLLFATIWGAGLSRLPASGGDPVVATKLDLARRESFHGNPQFLPGGKKFLYIVHTIAEKRNEIWAGSLEGEKAVQVMSADALVGYSKPYLLFVRDGAIYAQRFDPGSTRVSGEPARVVDNASFWETEADANATLSATGALVYAPFRPNRTLLNVYDRAGTVVRRLWEGDSFSEPALTRDEKTLVVAKFDPVKGAGDIVAIDLSRGIATRLTSGLAAHGFPLISPDGQSVVHLSDRDGMFDIYRKSIDGASPDEVVWKDERDKEPRDWSPDGKYLLVSRRAPDTADDIWVFPFGTGEKPFLFVGSDRPEGTARFSPDGKWVAYNSEQSGAEELYLRPFPSGRAVRVSAQGGGNVAWAPDGRELIWVTKENRIMSARVDLSGAAPQIATPKPLFTLPRTWSGPLVMRDGNIAIAVPAPGADAPQPFEFTTAWRMKIK